MSLIYTATNMGYKYSLVKGKGGSHCGYPGQIKKIQIGKNQPRVDKVIILAHEIGHALDLMYNPLTVQEVKILLEDWEEYEKSDKFYTREKDSWRRGRSLLLNLGAYKMTRDRFYELREEGLRSYYNQLRLNLNESTVAKQENV